MGVDGQLLELDAAGAVVIELLCDVELGVCAERFERVGRALCPSGWVLRPTGLCAAASNRKRGISGLSRIYGHFAVMVTFAW